MQSTVVFLDLDCIFLYSCWRFWMLGSFLVLLLQVEINLLTRSSGPKWHYQNYLTVNSSHVWLSGWDKWEDKHTKTLPPKRLKEHLVHMLDGVETMCKRSVFHDCNWMQTCLWGDVQKSEKKFLKFWYVQIHSVCRIWTRLKWSARIFFYPAIWAAFRQTLSSIAQFQIYHVWKQRRGDSPPPPIVCWYVVPQLCCRIWSNQFCSELHRLKLHIRLVSLEHCLKCTFWNTFWNAVFWDTDWGV